MDLTDYLRINEKMESNFGKTLDDIKTKLIFEKYKFLEYGQWEKIIQEVINTKKRVPSVAEIEEIYAKLFKSDYTKKQYSEQCKYCQGRGFFYWEIQKDNGLFYEYEVLCKCKNALNNLHKGFKNFNAEVLYPEFFNELDKIYAAGKVPGLTHTKIYLERCLDGNNQLRFVPKKQQF